MPRLMKHLTEYFGLVLKYLPILKSQKNIVALPIHNVILQNISLKRLRETL